MTVKDLITNLLNHDLNKQIMIEYPTPAGHIVGNYCRYNGVDDFEIHEYDHGVIIGIDNDDK